MEEVIPTRVGARGDGSGAIAVIYLCRRYRPNDSRHLCAWLAKSGSRQRWPIVRSPQCGARMRSIFSPGTVPGHYHGSVSNDTLSAGGGSLDEEALGISAPSVWASHTRRHPQLQHARLGTILRLTDCGSEGTRV